MKTQNLLKSKWVLQQFVDCIRIIFVTPKDNNFNDFFFHITVVQSDMLLLINNLLNSVDTYVFWLLRVIKFLNWVDSSYRNSHLVILVNKKCLSNPREQDVSYVSSRLFFNCGTEIYCKSLSSLECLRSLMFFVWSHWVRSCLSKVKCLIIKTQSCPSFLYI